MSETNEQTSRRKKSGESRVSRIFVYVAGAGAGILIYGGALRWFPLVNGIASPFFYPLLGVGFVARSRSLRGGRGGRKHSSSRDGRLR